jgi:hypothetical protein
MEMPSPQLSLELLWFDDDLADIKAIATNGNYSGSCSFYVSLVNNDLIELANSLRDFPKHREQIVEKHFGINNKELFDIKEHFLSFNPNISYLGLKFLCTDNKRHTSVIITMVNNINNQEIIRDRAFFEIHFDPVQLDEFIQEIFSLCKNKKGIARLNGKSNSF